jgi:hypothetical protein
VRYKRTVKYWVAIAALVPSRTKNQRHKRCHNVCGPDRMNRRTNKLKVAEDSKQKDVVQTHSGKSWDEMLGLKRTAVL